MFKYLDKVKIIKGFYKGLEGRLTEEIVNRDAKYKYDVEVFYQPDKEKGEVIFKTITVKENYIEKI